MTEPSPAPTPDRAIYGIVLYLGSYLALVLYLVWTFVPLSVLDSVGLSYWPQKYWALAVPIYLIIPVLLLGFCIYPGISFLMTPSFDSVNTITDDFAKTVLIPAYPDTIPPIGDIPVFEVSRKMYYTGHNHERPSTRTSPRKNKLKS